MFIRTIILTLVLVALHGCIDQQRAQAESQYLATPEVVGVWETGKVYKLRDGCRVLYVVSESGGYTDNRLYKPSIALDSSECPTKPNK